MPAVLAEIPIGVLASMIGKTIFSISTRGIALHAEWRAYWCCAKAAWPWSRPTGIVWRWSKVQANLPGSPAAYRALLPRKAMGELQKLASDSDPAAIVQFSGDDNHLFFQLGDRLLLSRKLTGNFPDYERVLPKDQPNSVTAANATNFAARSSAWRSFPTNGRERFACASMRAK